MKYQMYGLVASFRYIDQPQMHSQFNGMLSVFKLIITLSRPLSFLTFEYEH